MTNFDLPQSLAEAKHRLGRKETAMFSVRTDKAKAIISGCPESGIPSHDWMLANGLPAASSNVVAISAHLADEAFVREFSDVADRFGNISHNCHFSPYGFTPVVSADAYRQHLAGDSRPILREMRQLVKTHLAAQNARDEVLDKARAAAHAAEKAEREAKRRAEEEEMAATLRFLREWIPANCDIDAVSRFLDGFMVMDEAKDLVRDSTFEQLDRTFARYERMKHSLICECDEPAGCTLQCNTSACDRLTDPQYKEYCKIRDVAAAMSWPGMHEGACVTVRTHTCRTSDCGITRMRHAVLVTCQVGPFRLSREYSLPS